MTAGGQLLTREPTPASPARRAVPRYLHPVLLAAVVAAVLHLLWWWLLATSGGDLAAQDAWAEFARTHPGSAYNLAWYGGMHPVSYSVLSPYVMARLGVRTTMIIAGTISAGLLALLVVRSREVSRPWWPALFGALAFTCNAVSGRVTFGLGLMFGLAAVAVVFVWPRRWRTPTRAHRWPRGALAGVLSGLATASSPVAGLFVGVVAAALWLDRRRAAAYALGLPPVVVVALSSWLFPFSGHQPMSWDSTILPVAFGLTVFVLAPRSWRTVRIGALFYAVAVLAVWAVPSQIGTNINRLAMVFGGVLFVAVAAREPAPPTPGRWPTFLHAHRGRVALLVAAGIIASSIWQVAVAARDVIATRPTDAWSVDVDPLVHQLRSRHAGRARVEVVPTASHREASALAPDINLARGWNRQADAERNPVFYEDGLLTRASYRAWLDRWAVHYVVLPTGAPDHAAVDEAALVSRGPRYLREVWHDASWRLYEVQDPTPLADPPAVVTHFGAAEVVISMPRAGSVLVRIPDSPWLSLVDEQGHPLPGPASPVPGAPAVNLYGCLTASDPQPQPQPRGQRQDQAQDYAKVTDTWTVLHAPYAGTYRIAAPYKLPRGTSCPDGAAG